MNDSEKLLFVGGPADGKRISVPQGIPCWRIAVPQPLPMASAFCDEHVTTIKVDTVDYKREVLATPSGARFSVMCAPGENIIERLILGYKQTHGRGE